MNAKRATLAGMLALAAAFVAWLAFDDEGTPARVAAELPRLESEDEPAPRGPAAPDEPLAREAPIEMGPPALDAPHAAPELASFEIVGRIVDGASGAPIAAAELWLGARTYRQPPVEAHAIADAAGAVRARSLAMEPARLAASVFAEHEAIPESFLEVRADGYETLRLSPWNDSKGRAPLEVGGPIDLGEVELFRGALVTGRVVRASDGSGVADAAILLVEDEGYLGRFFAEQARELARSREDGSFELSERVGPSRGDVKRYVCAVSSEGFAWSLLDVLEGRERVEGLQVVLEPTVPVAVRVLDESGKPIEDASVVAEPRFEPLVHRAGRDHDLSFGPREDLAAVFTSSTDSNGIATLGRIPASRDNVYDIGAHAYGRAPAWRKEVQVRADKPMNEIVLTLVRFQARALAGVVRGDDGVPISGAKLTVNSSEDRLDTLSEANGRFRVIEPHPGTRATFVVSANGFSTVRREVELAASGDFDGIEFALARPLAISGRIVDQAGRPVEGAEIAVQHEDQWRQLSTEDGRTLTDGRFEFADTTAGEWILHVGAPRPESEWAVPKATHKVHGGDAALEIVFARAESEGAKLVAEIVDAASGAPLEPRAAVLIPIGDSQLPREELDVVRGPGRATAEGLRAGTWRLWVRVTDRAFGYRDFDVAPGQREVRERVELGEPGTLLGHVRFDERFPFRYLRVRADAGGGHDFPGGSDWNGDDQPSELFMSPAVEPDGTFRIGRVTPGHWRAVFRLDGFVGLGTADVPPGGVGKLAIEPRAGGRLVLRGEGFELTDWIEVRFMDEEAREWEPGSVLDNPKDGAFAHEETVIPGRVRWRVDFKHASYPGRPAGATAETQEGELTIGAGETLDVRVPFVPIGGKR